MRQHLKLPHEVQEEGVGEAAVRIQEEEEEEDMVATREVMDMVGMVGGGEGEEEEVDMVEEVDISLNPISEFMPCMHV